MEFIGGSKKDQQNLAVGKRRGDFCFSFFHWYPHFSRKGSVLRFFGFCFFAVVVLAILRVSSFKKKKKIFFFFFPSSGGKVLVAVVPQLGLFITVTTYGSVDVEEGGAAFPSLFAAASCSLFCCNCFRSSSFLASTVSRFFCSKSSRCW